MPDLAALLTDLHDESAELERLVTPLTDDQWLLPTPAAGWTIAHQISHLTWTDNQVADAATDPEAFVARMGAALVDAEHFVDDAAQAGLAEPAEMLRRWRTSRARVSAALTAMPSDVKHPWFGVRMNAVSSATGRLMETWAHGEDIAQALGELRMPSARLRHIAFLGHRTLGHSFLTHGRPAPTEPVYLELDAPDGTTWSYGPPDAENRIIGPATDFCLLITQRAHPDDLALKATGPVAREWLDVAQVYAGPPGTGRPPKAEVA